MYITKGAEQTGPDVFDWDEYFINKGSGSTKQSVNPKGVVADTRKHLSENESVFGFVFHKVMNTLFSSINLKDSPQVLELGAATGFFTRWIVQRYGGHGTLVDRSKEAYQAFLSTNSAQADHFTYVKEDIFDLNLGEKRFDIVGSFGVIEHFIEKAMIMNAHKKFAKRDGYVIIMIPLDSPLTRAFYEINFELNTGYRELLSENELKGIVQKAGLKVICSAKSEGYVYDFLGIVCVTN